jgi:peptide/nickel transport system permease protein
MIPTLILISITAFVIIQLPPGDYVTNLVAAMEAQGEYLNESAIAQLRAQYGLDDPIYVQYFRWFFGILQGDFGYSFAYNADVGELIGSRLFLTFILSLSTLIFTWVVAFPIGVFSATNQYSAPDYVVTFLGFMGLATPNFLLALILMWIAYSVFGVNVSGLFSKEFMDVPWSFAKVLDMINHLWVPMIVIGTAGTAGLIRVLRANLLDELGKPYVDAARAKGVAERKILYKYPIRIALIPFVSTIGWILPSLVSGATIVSVVLNLPTTGPMLLGALQSQDMYLAGSFIMFLSFLTLIGTLISDILLAWLDPRIRY